MPPSKRKLTPTLEDYLETIYRLVRQADRARVRDIMRIRGVKAGSVTPAIKRLAELGLVDYVQREHIALTAAGEQAARQVFARHLLLTRFFSEILGLEADEAEANACAMEHSLTPGAMDRLARFFEQLESGALCPLPGEDEQQPVEGAASEAVSLASGRVGRRYRIVQINGLARGRLLDLGLLPGATLTLEQRSARGLKIRHQQSSFALGKDEAANLQVMEIAT